MSFDIAHLLEQWDYHPGQVVVRRFKGKDGSDKIQLRVDLGVLQMNAEGRPDGKRPFGRESLLQHYQAKVEKYRAVHGGSDEGFSLKTEDCARLQQEAIQYHHRYICFYQLEDYESVLRDTNRNAEVFDFVDEYTEPEELGWSLQQFRPQLLLMQVRAKGTLALRDDRHEEAARMIEDSLEELRDFFREHSRQDLLEQSTEIQSLQTWLDEIRNNRPLSERERLEHALDDAVRREDFEKAARVRDALRNLKTPQ